MKLIIHNHTDKNWFLSQAWTNKAVIIDHPDELLSLPESSLVVCQQAYADLSAWLPHLQGTQIQLLWLLPSATQCIVSALLQQQNLEQAEQTWLQQFSLQQQHIRVLRKQLQALDIAQINAAPELFLQFCQQWAGEQVFSQITQAKAEAGIEAVFAAHFVSLSPVLTSNEQLRVALCQPLTEQETSLNAAQLFSLYKLQRNSLKTKQNKIKELEQLKLEQGQKLEQANQQLQQAIEANTGLTTQAGNIQQQLLTQQQAFNELQQKQTEAEQQKLQLLGELEACKKQMQQLNTQNSEQVAQLQQAQQQASNATELAEQQRQKLEQQLSASEQLCQQKLEQNKELSLKLHTLNQELVQANQKLELEKNALLQMRNQQQQLVALNQQSELEKAALLARLSQSAEQLQLALAEANVKSVEAAQIQAEMQQKLEEQTASFAQHRASTSAATTALQQENSLLLDQLHQVQEQLEQTYVAAQQDKQHLVVVTAQNIEAGQENKLLLTQLHQVQEQLESTSIQAKQQNQQLQQDLEKASTAKVAAEQENALVMEQLFLVQEELEKLFLQAQSKDQEFTEQTKQRDKKIVWLQKEYQKHRTEAEQLQSMLLNKEQQILDQNKVSEQLRLQLVKSTNDKVTLQQSAGKELSQLQNRYQQTADELSLLKQNLQKLSAELKTLKRTSKAESIKQQNEVSTLMAQIIQLKKARQELDFIKATTSWKLTKPVRFMSEGRRSKAEKAKLARDVQLLEQHDLFDAQWYYQQYPDVAASGMSAAEHYLCFGAQEGRNPGPVFDTQWYYRNYLDVALDGANPLVHYIKFGQNEGRHMSGNLLQDKSSIGSGL